MRGITVRRIRCEVCEVKIPKNQPKLRCTICDKFKHLKCQNLTKSDAEYIIQLKIPWTCHDCISDILPCNACQAPRNSKLKSSDQKFKVKCPVCNGFCYSPKNIRTCDYCDKIVHVKCWHYGLGCKTCCEDMIPGFHVYSNELIGDPNFKNDKMYNPYCSTHFTQLIGDVFDREYESNAEFCELSELLVNCKYKQATKNNAPTNQELSIFSLNIQTITNKVDELRENIALYDKFDVLLFNETNCMAKKLPNGKNDLELVGFHEPIIQDPIRPSSKGGGLIIYVNKRVCEEDSIKKITPYSEPDNTSGEFQFIKLLNCKNSRKTVILGNVYRSPSCKPDKFNTFFDTILQKLGNKKFSNKLTYIVGDFNQDLIQLEDNSDYQNLIDNAHNRGFVQLISRPTRITEHTHTLIDHVYTNNTESVLSCSILTLDISDHLATNTKISLGSSSTIIRRNLSNSKNGNSDFRLFNEANNQTFKNLINNESWDEITENMDAQTSYNKFEEIYLKHYDIAYPLKSNYIRRKNERQNSKPWILPWLEDACSRKNRLYHDYVKNPSPENKAKYDKLKEFCAKHVDIAKAKYHKSYFEKFRDNSRKQWQLINSLLNRKRKTISVNKLIDCDGTAASTPSKIADSFNKYFSNIATDLKQTNNNNSTVENDDHNFYEEFLKNPVNNTIHLIEVDQGEVFKIINDFKNKSTRDTKISALKVANTSYNFTKILTEIINKSFREGIFPEQMKIAKVIPIHKGGTKTEAGNYRPISLLNTFSKIYEKLMHSRILNFLEQNDSLYENQYGFRQGRSCEHALLNAQNSLLDSLNKRQISLLLLIDFSKAFDMVEHSILVSKLEHYGIRGLALNWIKSYLSNRQQFVSINGSDSSTQAMKYGVPQGSILGPLLFIIYINDMPSIAQYAKFVLYADDANIIITANTTEEIQTRVQKLIENLTKWVNYNGLALNLKKTQYMIFSRSKVELPTPLLILGKLIERKQEARFLGVIVDESLNWTKHIKTIQSKMARYIGIMYKLKKFLPLHARLQIFHSFVQSHINYCSLVWGFSCKSNIETLFSKQKKGMRAVIPGYVNYNYRHGILPGHTKSAFSEYEILTVQNLITSNAFLFMYKIGNCPSLLPLSVRSTISENRPTSDSTHESCEVWLNNYNNHIYNKSLFFKGPLMFVTTTLNENLPPESFINFKAYKKNIRKALLAQQKIGSADEWQNENFLLYNIVGLRKSCSQKERVNYTQFFE